MELKVSLHLDFDGEVRATYRGQAITLRQATLDIEAVLEGPPQSVKLRAQLDAAALMKMAPLFTGARERPRSGAVCIFTMTPAALTAHGPAFAGAGPLQEWVAAGDGACLKLENYALESMVTSTAREAIAETVDVEIAGEESAG